MGKEVEEKPRSIQRTKMEDIEWWGKAGGGTARSQRARREEGRERGVRQRPKLGRLEENFEFPTAPGAAAPAEKFRCMKVMQTLGGRFLLPLYFTFVTSTRPFFAHAPHGTRWKYFLTSICPPGIFETENLTEFLRTWMMMAHA